MSKNSYAEDIKNAEVMSAGLSQNAEQAARCGLDAAFVKNLRDSLGKSTVLNNEQERLKADLKEKTAALDTEMATLKAAVSLARKKIKIDFPQVRWVEFGISAKR